MTSSCVTYARVTVKYSSILVMLAINVNCLTHIVQNPTTTLNYASIN